MTPSSLRDRLATIESRLDAYSGRFAGQTRGRDASAAVASLEETQGVRLPEEYRAFLLRVGDGAPGLLPLSRWDEALMGTGHLAAPCVLDPERTFEGDADTDPARGTISLTEGNPCALLVVSGPRRGQVLYYDYANSWCEEIEDAVDGPLGFLAWYAQWLDTSAPDVSRLTVERLGETLLGDSDALLRVIDDPRTNVRRRVKAIRGLGRSEPSHTDVLRVLDHESGNTDVRVRLAAMQAQARLAATPEARLARVASFVKDPSPVVRQEVTKFLRCASNPARCRELLLGLLDDEDPSVTSAATSALLALSPSDPDLSHLLAHPAVRNTPDARRLLLFHLGDTRSTRWLRDVLPWIEDPDWRTRLMAVATIGKLGDPSACSVLVRRLPDEIVPNVRAVIRRAIEKLGGAHADATAR